MGKLPLLAQSAAEEYFRSTILEYSPHGSSSFSETVRLVFKDGRKAFLKYSSEISVGSYSAEACALRELRKQDSILVPEVYLVEDGSAPLRFLLVEFFETRRREESDEAILGKNLAMLHRLPAKQFGFATDNFIGANPQPNGWFDSWAEFFTERRLEFQFALAEKRGWLDSQKRILFRDALKAARDLLAEHHPEPSLLHGDLWGGNVLWTTRGPALIDPASFYGDRECDLAFTEMFGGFGPTFYQSYQDTWPLPKEFITRKVIYNWYHILNHANLFGGGYIVDSESAAKRIVKFCS